MADRLAYHLSSARTVYQLLHLSASGTTELLKEMLDTGVDVNAVDYDKRSALHLASAEGRFDTVKLLVERGANVNAVDRFGGTPLRDALESRRSDIVTYLRRQGSTLGEKSDFLIQKVCQAASEGNVLLLQNVFENSFLSIDAADYDARTPLHLAAACNHKKACEYLLKMGANPLALDRFGNTAIEEASREGHPELSEFLSAFHIDSPGGVEEQDSDSDDESCENIVDEGEMSPQETFFLEAVSIFINSSINKPTDQVQVKKLEQHSLTSIREGLEEEGEIFKDFFILFRNKFQFNESDDALKQEIQERISSAKPQIRQILDFLPRFYESCAKTNFFVEKEERITFCFVSDCFVNRQDLPKSMDRPMQFQFDFH
eukprot:CAMPEP_0201487778 /NCGR_PEP_ID=MMETSP0151_2-20130828/15222_1 /ASSEMBLY_ACC=CAM_ASM_000257 /TAXON_ID=200890 /ORGANISM="Paramoeba atlantica, Strain 621/1 / CCAP 1560/9" /LENGTH=373 /DNA_ID=CAMNT_0047872923 /DNA_START=38 /DNA_END=1159 /DNA_ORIENTATION=-